MKLNFSPAAIISLLGPKRILGVFETHIQYLSIDTRSYTQESNACFIALKGPFRNGVDFTEEAYRKNIRIFIVGEEPKIVHSEACYLVVDDTLLALQCIAKAHRDKFNIPILGISGKAGKTTVKEWLYELIKADYHVVRSPKSYNSQIGVALSLLELKRSCNLWNY